MLGCFLFLCYNNWLWWIVLFHAKFWIKAAMNSTWEIRGTSKTQAKERCELTMCFSSMGSAVVSLNYTQDKRVPLRLLGILLYPHWDAGSQLKKRKVHGSSPTVKYVHRGTFLALNLLSRFQKLMLIKSCIFKER